MHKKEIIVATIKDNEIIALETYRSDSEREQAKICPVPKQTVIGFATPFPHLH